MNKISGKKSVGQNISAKNSNWSFAGQTATNFTSHVKNSVPLYEQGHDLILRLSDFFLPNNSTCYDLGVSNGNLILNLAKRHSEKKVEFIGIDIEKDMIHEAKRRLGERYNNVTLKCQNLEVCKLKKSDMIISYYTMQFIHPRHRQDVINKIYSSLNWGGCLLLFEKVRGSDARFQDIWTAVYNDFKLEQGFSSEEIMNKSRSLKGILEPFSMQGNVDLLSRAGFKDIATVMMYVPFAGILAIK